MPDRHGGYNNAVIAVLAGNLGHSSLNHGAGGYWTPRKNSRCLPTREPSETDIHHESGPYHVTRRVARVGRGFLFIQRLHLMPRKDYSNW